jgi:hypothetical protein
MSDNNNQENKLSENLNSNNVNNTNNTNNSNNNNIIIPQKKSSSEQLLFFKDEVLKDLKALESKLSLKYDIQHTLNANKIKKIEGTIDQISQRIAYLSSQIITDNTMKEKVEKISTWNNKTDETLILLDIRLKNIGTKLTETIDKYDNLFMETVVYPGVIGPKARYKTFHECIDFLIFNIGQLLIYKEKSTVEVKDYRYKMDSLISNLQMKLDYLSKNTRAFTSSSLKNTEKKMEQTFKAQFDDFRTQFALFKSTQEEKILNLIENYKKIQNLEKDFKEFVAKNDKVRRSKKRYSTINDNVSLSMNNEKMRSNSNFDFNISKATSVVRDYIKGKINENELRSRRRSVQLRVIKTNDKIIDRYPKSPKKTSKKKESNKNISFDKISSNNSSLTSVDEKSDEKEKEKEKKIGIKKDKNKEKEKEVETSNNEKEKEEKKEEKSYEFQKNLIRVSGSENDLIRRRDKKISSKKDDDDNSINNNNTLSLQLLQMKRNSIHPDESNNNNISDADSQSIKKSNNVVINYNMINSNNKRNKISNKTLESPKMKESHTNNNNSYIMSKKYENINDVKTIIKIIKKESRESLIPIIPLNRINDRTINNSNLSSRNKKILNENFNNSNNKIFNQNYYKTRYDTPKLKLKANNKNLLYNNSANSFYDGKKMKNVYSSDSSIFKSKWNNVKKVDVNFNPYSENSKEKDEQKMTKIFNQMKDYLPSDEKALIKDRFGKYGYSKEKIFLNKNNVKKRFGIEEDINIVFSNNKHNNNIHNLKSINYEGK